MGEFINSREHPDRFNRWNNRTSVAAATAGFLTAAAGGGSTEVGKAMDAARSEFGNPFFIAAGGGVGDVASGAAIGVALTSFDMLILSSQDFGEWAQSKLNTLARGTAFVAGAAVYAAFGLVLGQYDTAAFVYLVTPVAVTWTGAMLVGLGAAVAGFGLAGALSGCI